MTQMTKFRKILMIIVLIIIAAILTQFNFTDLSFKMNKFNYIAIFSGVCTLLALYFSNKHEKRKYNRL